MYTVSQKLSHLMFVNFGKLLSNIKWLTFCDTVYTVPFNGWFVIRVVTVRFDRGFGPGVVRSKNSVIQGQWNRVRLHCDNWNGYVQLNDGQTARGKPKV